MRVLHKHRKGEWKKRFPHNLPSHTGGPLMATDDGKQFFRFKRGRAGQIVRKHPKTPSRTARRRLGLPR